MTSQQIKWAASHDWFVMDNGNGTITVRDDLGGPLLTWTGSFSELRAWAGY